MKRARLAHRLGLLLVVPSGRASTRLRALAPRAERAPGSTSGYRLGGTRLPRRAWDLEPIHRGRQGVRRAAGVLCQRKRASLGVAADRPDLARMHYRSAVGAHTLERGDQIVDRKIR